MNPGRKLGRLASYQARLLAHKFINSILLLNIMPTEKVIKKKIKELEERFPGTAEQVEHELLPMQGEEPRIITKKRKKL